jgi:uncharacterized protein (TIGR02145 family)
MRINLLFSYIITVLVIVSCGKSGPSAPTPPAATVPVMNAVAGITAITAVSALSGGNISSDGGATVTSRGVCWNTAPSPTIANSKSVDGSGTGLFTSNLTGLNPGTVYYVRAYATNSVGTAYAAELSFTTLAAPSVPSLAATTAAGSITLNSVISGGNVTSDGGAGVTARGVCWSTSSNPTTVNSKTTDGTGTGTFTSTLTGLTANTVYYVRSYATNAAGTGYGSEISFTSLQIGTVAICSQLWMDRNLSVGNYRNGDPIPLVTDATAWANLTTGAYCFYNNDPSTEAVYGRLYNWYAASDPRGLAPTGWHMPTEAEWRTLGACVGGISGLSVAGGPLKEAGTSHWLSPNSGATNSSGFTALPGGYRTDFGTFAAIGEYAHWWGPEAFNATLGLGAGVWNFNVVLDIIGADKRNGWNVRCIKN